MKRLLPGLFGLLILFAACQSSGQQDEEPDTSDTTNTDTITQEEPQAYAKAVDEDIATLEEDGTAQRKDKEWQLEDGSAKMNAWYKDEKLLMIQEEKISTQQAQRQRYYFKENKLVYATEFSVDKTCSDTADMCVNETRCYFDNDRMVCEYTRGMSIPAGKLEGFDDPYLQKALDRIHLQQQRADPAKVPTIMRNAEKLIEKWEEKGDT